MKKISVVLSVLAFMFVVLPIVHAEESGTSVDVGDQTYINNKELREHVRFDANGMPIPGKYGPTRPKINDERGGGMGIGAGFKELRTEWKNGKEQTRTQMEDARKEFNAERGVLKNDADAKREEFRSKMHEMQGELKSKIGQMRGVIFLRFTTAITRLENIQIRMQTRIDTLKTANNDMTEAQTSLDSSKVHLAKAKDSLSQARTLIETTRDTTPTATATTSADTSTTNDTTILPVISQSVKDQIHALLKTTKDELKLAFEDMRNVLRIIKSIERPDESEDDSTTTSTSSTSTITQ